ncbi:MAG: GWxTD domain-containing protein [Ignavibacteria bacterium]|jgi:GWxTD domain-containing protein
MKYILFFLLFSTVILCQPGRFERGEQLQQSHELHPTIQILPSGESEVNLEYIYRIPHDRLIFERRDNTFLASVRIQVEVYEDDDLVVREFVDKKITVDDFNIVKSKFASVQGVINFSLSENNYTVKGIVTDLNVQKDIKFRTLEISISELIETGIYSPIVISSDKTDCDGNILPHCVNYGGVIPYSSSTYDLIIPIIDTSISTIQVEIEKNDDDPIIIDVPDYFTSNIDIVECNEGVFINEKDSAVVTRNFIVKEINKDLHEGRIITNVKINDDYTQKFPLLIGWLNKPFSLRNPEFAIEMLKYIDDESVVLELLDADEEEYPKVLHEYWKQFDPTPETEFNELMEEFYSRIDYAAMEFRGINKKNGLSTDRGRIYVKNGKPDNIERSSDEDGYIVEIWTYNGTKRKFQFVDKQGTGNFILIEG